MKNFVIRVRCDTPGENDRASLNFMDIVARRGILFALDELGGWECENISVEMDENQETE